MGKYGSLIIICALASCAIIVTAQFTVTRCLQYTWLGPSYNNESVFMNATCNDVVKLATGVPCFKPLVVSYDGTPPDIDLMLDMYPDAVLCQLAANDVCATYTYYFNGKVENSTKMCTRAVTANDTAITSGCYEQNIGSYKIQTCFCRSIPGGRPCNAANQTTLVSAFAITLAAIVASYINIKMI